VSFQCGVLKKFTDYHYTIPIALMSIDLIWESAMDRREFPRGETLLGLVTSNLREDSAESALVIGEIKAILYTNYSEISAYVRSGST
jgi:hypothetical protein